MMSLKSRWEYYNTFEKHDVLSKRFDTEEKQQLIAKALKVSLRENMSLIALTSIVFNLFLIMAILYLTL